MRESLEASKILFLFECENCNNKVYIDVFEILNSGAPLCCKEEMKIISKGYSMTRSQMVRQKTLDLLYSGSSPDGSAKILNRKDLYIVVNPCTKCLIISVCINPCSRLNQYSKHVNNCCLKINIPEWIKKYEVRPRVLDMYKDFYVTVKKENGRVVE